MTDTGRVKRCIIIIIIIIIIISAVANNEIYDAKDFVYSHAQYTNGANLLII